jgi:hypothetical protein
MIVSEQEKKSFGVVSVTDVTSASCFEVADGASTARHNDVIGTQLEAYLGRTTVITVSCGPAAP